MAIRRACSYQAVIKTPRPAADYSAILVTVAQSGVNLINKEAYQMEIVGDNVTMKLTQEETAQFKAYTPAQIQIRCYADVFDAPGSAVWTVDVLDALNDVILPISDQEGE